MENDYDIITHVDIRETVAKNIEKKLFEKRFYSSTFYASRFTELHNNKHNSEKCF